MGYSLCAVMLLMVPLVITASKYFPNRRAFLLSPLCVFVFAWGASGAIYLSGSDFLRERTAMALLSFYLSFIVASGYVLFRFSRSLKIHEVPASHSRSTFVPILLALQVLAFVAAATHLYYAFQQIHGSGLTEVRGVLATQKFDVPIVIKLLGQLRYANYFAPIAVYAECERGKSRKTTVFLSFALACLYPLCYLERSGVIRMLMLVLFAYLYFSVDSPKKLMKLGVVAAVVLTPIVIAIPVLRGQAEGANAYAYVAGAWSGFDNFVSGSGTGPVVVLEDQPIYVKPHGYELGESPPFIQTMTELYRICDTIEACSVRLPNFFEYVYAPVYTNIYTLARTFYQDFGPYGAPFATALFAASLTIAYVVCVSGGGILQVYVAAYLAYVCAMSVLSDNFLGRDIVLAGLFIYAFAFVFGSGRFWLGTARTTMLPVARPRRPQVK